MPAARIRFVVGLLLVVSLCSTTWADDDGLRLLFVGNSLTYTNDLPGMLAGLLEWSGTKIARIESQARPDFGLQDHWSSKQTLKMIASEQWDVVIIQQGPSATEGRPSLLEFSRLIAGEVRKAGGQPALYMVWPSTQRLQDFPGVAYSYRSAALQVDGMLFPVGEAWMAALLKDPEIPLYRRDGFHPSRLGTYLAALVMFEQLTGCDPRNLPAMIPGLHKGDPIKPGRARILQQAAVVSNANGALDRTQAETACLMSKSNE
jgi:hypothetical protein